MLTVPAQRPPPAGRLAGGGATTLGGCLWAIGCSRGRPSSRRWQASWREPCGEGPLALIRGVAGIGKSSLLASTAELAAAGGLTVLRARGGVLEHDLTYGVVG
jgi:hypothetical protein